MRVFLIYLIILTLGFGCLGGFLYLSVNKVLAQEYLPTDFLKNGDSFNLIVHVNEIGVTAVTYHYEYAD
jgi:hypothetical protein